MHCSSVGVGHVLRVPTSVVVVRVDVVLDPVSVPVVVLGEVLRS